MKSIDALQVVNGVDLISVILLSITLLWIMPNIVRFFAAGNYYDKSRGGDSIRNALITIYIILFVWGIFHLIVDNFL